MAGDIELAGAVALDAIDEADPAEIVSDDAALADAWRSLSPRDREVLRLAAWEGLDPREMGLALGCSSNAAAIRLHRARRRLEEAMSETEGVS